MSSQGAIYLRHLPWQPKQYLVLLELHIILLHKDWKTKCSSVDSYKNKVLWYCTTTHTQCVPIFYLMTVVISVIIHTGGKCSNLIPLAVTLIINLDVTNA